MDIVISWQSSFCENSTCTLKLHSRDISGCGLGVSGCGQLTSTRADFAGLKRENDVVRVFAEFADKAFPLTDWAGLDVTHCLKQQATKLLQLHTCLQLNTNTQCVHTEHRQQQQRQQQSTLTSRKSLRENELRSVVHGEALSNIWFSLNINHHSLTINTLHHHHTHTCEHVDMSLDTA